jgi:hypothetical protein
MLASRRVTCGGRRDEAKNIRAPAPRESRALPSFFAGRHERTGDELSPRTLSEGGRMIHQPVCAPARHCRRLHRARSHPPGPGRKKPEEKARPRAPAPPSARPERERPRAHDAVEEWQIARDDDDDDDPREIARWSNDGVDMLNVRTRGRDAGWAAMRRAPRRAKRGAARRRSRV